MPPAQGGELRPSVHLPVGDRRSREAVLCHAEPKLDDLFLSHSPTLRPWIVVRRLRTAGAVDVLRGGALEPDPCTPPEIEQAKAHAYCQRLFPARSAEVFLSQAGPQLDLECFTLSITFGSDVGLIAFSTKKATRLGRPRLACYAARDLARIPPSEG